MDRRLHIHRSTKVRGRGGGKVDDMEGVKVVRGKWVTGEGDAATFDAVTKEVVLQFGRRRVTDAEAAKRKVACVRENTDVAFTQTSKNRTARNLGSSAFVSLCGLLTRNLLASFPCQNFALLSSVTRVGFC